MPGTPWARASSKAGLKATVISNGYIKAEPLREVLPLLSAIKVDLKSFRDAFYREQVRGELAPVLEALTLIREAEVWLEIVDLLIPTLNDSEREPSSDVLSAFSQYEIRPVQWSQRDNYLADLSA